MTRRKTACLALASLLAVGSDALAYLKMSTTAETALRQDPASAEKEELIPAETKVYAEPSKTRTVDDVMWINALLPDARRGWVKYRDLVKLKEHPGDGEARSSAGDGKGLEIERVWEDYGTAYALVRVRNTSGRTLESVLTVQCVVLDKGGRMLNENTRSIYAHEAGPIREGAEHVLKVPVDLAGAAAFDSMRCKVTQAR